MDTKAIRMGMTIGLGAMLMAMGACMGGRSDGNWNVGRADPDADINLTYRFNENDARIIYEGMVEDALSKPWLDEWIARKGKQPFVYVGRIRNDTEEYIDAELFTKRIEEELINSRRVRVVADQSQRAELREERIGQQEFSRPETIKKVANEIGADIALVGKIAQVFQQTNDRRTVSNYFQVSLELIDVETNEKLWIETEPVRKMATR